MVADYQLVFCIGPRCCTRGEPGELMARARALVDGDVGLRARVHLATFDCLARCPAGPNVVVRELPAGAGDPGEPGMAQLTGLHYWGVDDALLERVLREHCGRGAALPGRHQRY